jgi:hypothetical protein
VSATESSFVDLSTRANWASVAMGGMAVVALIALGVDVGEIDLIQRIESGESATVEEVARNDDRQAAMAVVYIAALIVNAALFISWFHRAYKNLPSLGVSGRYGSGWAIGGWFVPILAMWRPLQIANDTWRASHPELARTDTRENEDESSVPTRQYVWWWSWVAGAIAGSASFRALGTAEEISEFKVSTSIQLASDGLLLVSAVLAITVIVSTSRRQRERFQRVASTRPFSVEDDATARNELNQSGFKVCPDCAEEIRAHAKICRFCRHEFQHCPECGELLEDKTRCAHCGFELTGETLYCRDCKAAVSRSTTTCDECGATLDDNE